MQLWVVLIVASCKRKCNCELQLQPYMQPRLHLIVDFSQSHPAAKWRHSCHVVMVGWRGYAVN